MPNGHSVRWRNRFISANMIIMVTLVLFCAGVRIWFWLTTHATFEDAFITFRYAEQIAAGNGFVYNVGEHVLGTTTPLWTILLALARTLGAHLITTSALLGIGLDCLTCILIFSCIPQISNLTAYFWVFLFALSPEIVPVTVSGMETSLLLCSMSIALSGYLKKDSLFGFGLALTILTRIDGGLFAVIMLGAVLLYDRRFCLQQLILVCLFSLPWFVFSWMYFGNALPQSLLAKHTLYHESMQASLGPFLYAFTPFLESQILRIAIKSVFMIFIIIGLVQLWTRRSMLIPIGVFIVVYCTLFVSSGTIIFSWYSIPPIFFSYLLMALALEWTIGTVYRYIHRFIGIGSILAVVVTGFLLVKGVAIVQRKERSLQMQMFEEDVRKTIGLWVKNHVPAGSKVFLEPLGYIGYFAGLDIILHDEIGLVDPSIVEYRKSRKDWYLETLRSWNADYIVQYTTALELNKSEGVQTPLFSDVDEKERFLSVYKPVYTIDATGFFPFLAEKEKRYTIFKKQGL